MYDADWLPRLIALARSGRSTPRWKIPGNVWGLGITSLLTDASSEMIVSVLPAYLVLSAGLAPLALGMATGLHAGGPILAILTNAPGNGESIGGLKAVTDNGWFAVRPSGTEDVYKLYAESFKDREHLARIQGEAQALVARLFASRSNPPATTAGGS